MHPRMPEIIHITSKWLELAIKYLKEEIYFHKILVRKRGW